MLEGRGPEAASGRSDEGKLSQQKICGGGGKLKWEQQERLWDREQ